MKKLVWALLLVSGAALAQTPAPVPAPVQDSALPPETTYSHGYQDYVEGTWQGWRILNGLLFPVEGSSFPGANYSLWTDPVCFNVYGLSAGAKYVVEKRMKEIAAQVGAPVDRKDPCEANVTIAFTTDPAATLKSIADVRPWLVPGVGLIRNRVREAQPVQAWYANMIKGKDGRAVLSDGYGEAYVFNAGPMTRLDTGVTYHIGAVTVIVDTKAIMGMPLGSLADYFAMITLAEARFGFRCKEVESIANLMQKDCAPGLIPKEITNNDIFLLKALYQTPYETLQFLQSVRMAGKVRKMLEAEAAAAEPKK